MDQIQDDREWSTEEPPYWLKPRIWLTKTLELVIAVVLFLWLPAAIVVSRVYKWVRSLLPWKRRRIVKDNVVVITGASSGIGECLALEYADRGAKVVLAARRENRLREVAEKCMQRGARDAAFLKTDVSKLEDCEKLINFAVDTFGRIDILVNNAGSAAVAAFEEYPSIPEFQKILDVDFWGNIWPTKFALEHLRRTRGQIVVTCSVAAFVPYPKQSFYNAAKAALLNFYDTLRIEPIGERVSITIALPGFVVSELTTKGPPGHIPKWWPMMETDEAARTIVQAAVEEKHYIIVPYWYIFNLFYRTFAPELLDWPPRVFLLGKPPNKEIKMICEMLLGEENTQKLFQKFTAFT
ncbi:unnamed protein product [Sphagnum balticum]